MSSDRLFELRRRTFDTPHFRGIEFIEVEAKSIINHVPGNYLPFSWTINPYRGCSHSCSYCVSGETEILMANGRTRTMADIRPGDRIYGTEVQGRYRRYVTTEVVDHWSTVKRAYRVRLEDGSSLIASADHRFLSDRGWKHVVGAESGPLQRSHLTVNNRLLGPGVIPVGPKAEDDYRRGYLTGMIRGDGTLGTYPLRRKGKPDSVVHSFRLALVDTEALDRTQSYLEMLGIPTNRFCFHVGTETTRTAMAIRTGRREGVAAIRNIVEWPCLPSNGWCKGFLAGVFDAEGSFSKGVLRISNSDPDILHWIVASTESFGFKTAWEENKDQRSKEVNKRVNNIRIRGGLAEQLRFFLTVDPAITRKRTFESAAVKNSPPRRVVSIDDLGFDIPMYDITTGTGDFIANGVISHNCFARASHTFLDMDAGRDFETKIVVKVNAGQLLRKELRAKRWKGESIAMGTSTDPYQRAEGKYKLMPQIISALTEVGNPFSILTKGTLIMRDLELLQEAAAVTDVSTAFSIGTLDEEVWRTSEPGTPHPRKRVEAVAKLNAAGIPCGVLVAPLLPGLSDSPEQIREVVEACVDAGATNVSPILLHLRPKVREVYMEWLKDNYPDLVDRYEAMYAHSAYASKGAQAEASEKVYDVLDEMKLKGRWKPKRRSHRQQPPPPVPPSEQKQLSLI